METIKLLNSEQVDYVFFDHLLQRESWFISFLRLPLTKSRRQSTNDNYSSIQK